MTERPANEGVRQGRVFTTLNLNIRIGNVLRAKGAMVRLFAMVKRGLTSSCIRTSIFMTIAGGNARSSAGGGMKRCATRAINFEKSTTGTVTGTVSILGTWSWNPGRPLCWPPKFELDSLDRASRYFVEKVSLYFFLAVEKKLTRSPILSLQAHLQGVYERM